MSISFHFRMKEKSSGHVSIREIAAAAEVSKSTVSYALQNSPKIGEATRQRIHQIAAKLGYTRNARVASLMSGVRQSKNAEVLPIAWLNGVSRWKDAWQRFKFLSPYLDGARQRSLELGYRLDELWLYQPGMTKRRIAQIIEHRGISGVIIPKHIGRLRLNWSRIAAVAIEGGLLAPRIHRVRTDYCFNLQLALKMVKRHRYKRVGICLQEGLDRVTNHLLRAIAFETQAARPAAEQVPSLFHSNATENWKRAKGEAIEWMRIHKPEVVICHHSSLVEWAKEAGFRVPQDIGIVHLAIDDDVRDWTGIYSNKRMIGAAAVELLVALIQSNQISLPRSPMDMYIRGTWEPGNTLLIPRPSRSRLL